MMKILNFLRPVFEWFWPNEIPEESNKKNPENENTSFEIPNIDDPKIISYEANKLLVSSKMPGSEELNLDLPSGIATLKKTELLQCSCGRLTKAPYGKCSECKLFICSAEHFFSCHKCGRGLCIKCVRRYSDVFTLVPLCESCFGVAKLFGLEDG